MLKSKFSKIIKNKAQEIGFDFCGISKAEYLEEQAPILERLLFRLDIIGIL